MLEISVETSGMLALVQDPQLAAKYASVVRSAHRQAWKEWGRLKKGRVGLRARFGRDNLQWIQNRSRQYQKRQRRFFGETRAYESPNRSKPPALKMRGRMETEGVGWRVGVRNSSAEVTSLAVFPGAAALNFGPPIYRRQFIGWDENDADRDWLAHRISELIDEGIAKLAARAATRKSA